MAVYDIPLDRVEANPYQTRRPDRKVVRRLAKSIMAEGLLQVPKGRWLQYRESVELAFGHTRLEAFRLLASGKLGEDIAGTFEVMPVEVVKLDDRQMSEWAIRENRDRDDLSPIEDAKAMVAYMADFDATPKDVGKLWGLTAPTVRNKLRLLKLPEPIVKYVDSGEIAERNARTLLAVARVSPGSAAKLADEIAGTENVSSQDIEHWAGLALRDNAVQLNQSWSLDDTVGRDLWMLDDPFEGEAHITPGTYGKAIADLFEDYDEAKLQAKTILADEAEGNSLRSYDPDAVQRLKHLREPPACSACPFHTSLRGAHYCGLKACYLVKKKAFAQVQAEKVGRKRKLKSIPWYSRKDDGRKVSAATTYRSGLREEIEERFEAGDPDLRLAARTSPAWQDDRVSGSKWVDVVLVGEAAEPWLEERERDRSTPEDWEAERRRNEVLRAQRDAVVAIAAESFATLFAKIDDFKLASRLIRMIQHDYGWERDRPLFDGDDPKAGKERTELARFWLAREFVSRYMEFRTWEQGPAAVAKEIEGIARTAGVKLPKNWSADLLEGMEVIE